MIGRIGPVAGSRRYDTDHPFLQHKRAVLEFDHAFSMPYIIDIETVMGIDRDKVMIKKPRAETDRCLGNEQGITHVFASRLGHEHFFHHRFEKRCQRDRFFKRARS